MLLSPASGVFDEPLDGPAVVVPQDPLTSFPYFFYFVIDHVISLNRRTKYEAKTS